MSNNNQKTACIIGGGMSGLFTGALLAKNGYKVTVLEKNHIIGGGLQSFRRGDAVFNTGMQTFAGYSPNMICNGFFNYLGINNNLRIMPTNSNVQEIIWMDDKSFVSLPKGREAYQNYLIDLFPNEKVGILMLIDTIFNIGHTYDYLFLRQVQLHPETIKFAYMSADSFIHQYIKDEKLISIFSYIGWTTGHNLSAMPALEFCMMLTLYIQGSYRFIGGSKILVESLNNIIYNAGGQIINNTTITDIEIIENKVISVASQNKKWSADYFIWACSPKILLNITDYPIFRSSMTNRIKEYKNSFSCSIIFCKLKKHTFKFINSAIYIPLFSPKKVFPQSLLLVTDPLEENQQWANTLDIYIPSSIDDFTQWNDTTLGLRGSEYEHYKSQFAENILNYISLYYPSIKENIDFYEVSTPLTIRDYYGNPNGACYGQQGIYIPIKTKISNLFMAGQAIQNQGIAGIATTSIFLTETILRRSLIEEIAVAK